MMKFIEFDEETCDSCYKCLRTCPTKAISFNKNQRHIIDSLCIKCGICQKTCPREALHIRNNAERIMEMINNGEEVAVSLAPSYVGAFGLDTPKVIVGALKAIGFSFVEETAIGAEMVASQYDEYIMKGDGGNMITSCCPSATYLIEQHYPTLISSVIPVVSPMIAHGKNIKAVYGQQVKVVFIGPCMAKIAEAEEISGAIDGVMTFEELDGLIKNRGMNLNEYEAMDFRRSSYSRGRAFPLGGSLKKNGEMNKDGEYRFFHVDGIEACKEVLNEIMKGSLNHTCIEMNICEGSCMNGPDMPINKLGRFARELFMRKYVEKGVYLNAEKVKSESNEVCLKDKCVQKDELSRQFSDKKLYQQEPNVEKIRQTMANMGKYSKDDELNCGACGYKTCYDKAKAVLLGYSEIETCLPYLREKAESMQSLMIENSPNGVVLLNKRLEIVEVNPAFNKMFNSENLPIEEMPIKLFVDHNVFNEVLDKEQSVFNKKIFINDLDCYFFVNVVYLNETKSVLGFLTDISLNEQRQKEFTRVKEETLLKTQEVIDKQMRVAQEIASLLGETTAETKMSLKSLHKLVSNEGSVF
jgi:iron only hydrogenase large subunit-like protein/uncharacterized Fe-S cluster-containing protein